MISGMTTVVGIVADPIGHVKTPAAFNAYMAVRHCDAVMVPLRVSREALAPLLAGLAAAGSLRGLVVTLPHKEAVAAHCTQLTAAARRSGAVNVLRFEPNGGITGTNTDGEGFLAGLRAQGIEVRGQAVYLAGAGGAAKAIGSALLETGVIALGLYNRTPSRAEELLARLRQEYPACSIQLESAAPRGYHLAINATSLGLQAQDPLPFSLDQLRPSCCVAEVVMKTDLTPLLAQAQQRGHRIHFGRHMLDGQIARIAHFFGLPPESTEGSPPHE